MDIPKDHPRYKSLMSRHNLQAGLATGMTTPTGLIAHGRGEAFDYLLGERTHLFADQSARAAAAMMLSAEHPVISVNGNTAALVRDEMIDLCRTLPKCQLEINIFHDGGQRRELIAAHFASAGATILGIKPDATLANLTSARARVDSRGMAKADVVLVSLEDGDRTSALIGAGKSVIAVDLNPLSRTPQTATLSITDNVERAIPNITRYVQELTDAGRPQWESIVSEFDNKIALDAAISAIRGGAR